MLKTKSVGGFCRYLKSKWMSFMIVSSFFLFVWEVKMRGRKKLEEDEIGEHILYNTIVPIFNDSFHFSCSPLS